MTKAPNVEDDKSAKLAKSMIDLRHRDLSRYKDISESSDEGGVQKKKITRSDNLKEREKRKMLDKHRCILLGTGHPEVCHIVPWSTNSEERHRERMYKYFSSAIATLFSPDRARNDVIYTRPDEGGDDDDVLMGDDDDEVVAPPVNPRASYQHRLMLDSRTYFASKVGVSDRAWNAALMNGLNHTLWGEGYFALKPISIEPCPAGTYPEDDVRPSRKAKSIERPTYSRVKVQFYWMLRRGDYPEKTPLLDLESLKTPGGVRSMLGRTYGDADPNNPVYAQHRAVSLNHMIQTGDVFYVPVETRYAHRMFLAFTIQWYAIRVFSLAGGAESLEDVDDDPEYLDANLLWPETALSMEDLLED